MDNSAITAIPPNVSRGEVPFTIGGQVYNAPVTLGKLAACENLIEGVLPLITRITAKNFKAMEIIQVCQIALHGMAGAPTALEIAELVFKDGWANQIGSVMRFLDELTEAGSAKDAPISPKKTPAP